MFSRPRITVALAGAIFLAACAYAGYANELLKDAISPLHRVVIFIGFILGAGCVSRWLMVQEIKRNMSRIRRARLERERDS